MSYNKFFIYRAFIPLLLLACSKNDDNKDISGNTVATLAVAMTAYDKIRHAWNDEIRPQLATESHTFSDYVIRGKEGTAVIKGVYSETNQSSSSTRLNQYEMDATIHFDGFVSGSGARIDGDLIFYEIYSSRCTNGTCATHSAFQYHSPVIDDTDPPTVIPVSIVFEDNGKRYNDKIYLNATKDWDRSSSDIKLLNGDGELFEW